MKKLLLVRHAKSDWESNTTRDFDRPLNKRGHSNAPEMARRLLAKNLIPELLVTSPALRALSTATYFAEVLAFASPRIQEEKTIYEASSRALLSVVNSLDNHLNFVALFGHNPGLTSFAIDLCSCDIYNIPTTGMILIEFPFDSWDMVSYQTGNKVFFDYPKNTGSQ